MGIMRQSVSCDKCQGRGNTIPYKMICTQCKGKKTQNTSKVITVDIEKGSKNGKQIRFKGEADEEPGCQTGDVVFIINEEKHKSFQRDGDNLIINKEVPLVNALTGFSFELEHLDGRKIFISTPENFIIEPESVLEVPDLGMPIHNYPFEFGSLYVKFEVQFPTSLNATQQTQLKTTLAKNLIVATPSEEGIDKVFLEPVNQERNRARQQQQHRHHHGAAYSSDDDDEGFHRGGPQGVQCSQQ